MGSLTAGIFTALLLASVLALPSKRIRRDTEIDTQNFVGDGTNELATAILQGFVDTDENLAFSPLGHSVLLAILAEGANGNTREQLVKAIHLPESIALRRSAYKNVLQRLTKRYSTNKPQFRNWFYIYKNFSVDQEYKKNLEENYLTEIRDVDRLDSETSSENTEEETTESNEEKKEESIMPDTMEDSNMPEKLEEIKLPEKIEDSIPENVENLKNPETIDDSVMPEKIQDSIIPENIQDSIIPENIQDSIVPENIQDSIIPENIQDSIMPEKIKDSMMPEKMEDSKTPEKIEDTMMPEKSEDSKVPQNMEDSIIPENIEELIKPENADSDNPEKTEDSKIEDEIKPEILVETTVSEKLEEKLPEKTEISDEEEETMQLSDVEAPSKEKENTESRQFSSFDYSVPSTIRKLEEERKHKPNLFVITLQQEILGDKEKDNEEIKDDKKETVEDEIKDKNKEKIKEDKTECEKKSELIDKIKEDFAESIRDIIKDEKEETASDSEIKDEIKEDMEINKNEEKTETAEDEMKENDGKEVIKEEEITGENDKKDDIIAEVIPQKVLNVKPLSEDELIREEIKEKGAKERNVRSLEHLKGRFGTYLAKNDVSSSLSSNNIVGKGTKSKKISQILVFNAMYFKGNWEIPFTRHKIDSFYKSDTEKSTVTMMGTQGTFRVGNIPDLDSKAIELPYQGDRYSLLILMPNSRTGLRQLISDLTGYPLRNVQKYLTPQEVEVCLPSFEIKTTTNPVEALSKFGVTDVFNQEKADLSGISEASGLFVEELVQYVTVNVDEGSSSYNYMSASNPSTRTAISKYAADSPFLYFVRDKQENIIIVAGKVVDPSIKPKSP